MLRTLRSRCRRAEGNELIEFALVLPLLVLLLAGVIEFGRAFYSYNILTKSVRNAARYLSATQISPAGVVGGTYVSKAQNLAMYGNVTGSGASLLPNMDSGDITVSSVATPGPSIGQFYVTVSADYAYTPLFGFYLSGVSFRPKVTMLFVGVVTGT